MPAEAAAPSTVLLERKGAVAIITLNEPERLNALSIPMREELHDVLADVMADDGIRAVLLTGADGTFCAGGDLHSMDGVVGIAARTRLRRAHRLIRLIVRGDKPVIAAVEGNAAGAGLSLAAACDVIVAATNAKFTGAFGRIGLIPDLGSMWTVPARIGTGAARRLLLLGESCDGEEALRTGLVEKIVAPGTAFDEAMVVAERLAAGAPGAIASLKAMFARAPQDLDALLDGEAEAQAVLFSSEDFIEGRKAFLERRKPQFKGQ
jgi:enoyl-CoA hydratase/carnithine racemase